MSRHEAFDRMKATLADQLAAAREARERTELDQMLAVLIVLGIAGVACAAAVLWEVAQ
jgi:hypothetical protein